LQRCAERKHVIVVMLARRARVAEQHSEADRLVGEMRVTQAPAEIIRDIAVEVELARLDQLHHADGDHQLADGGDARGIVDGDAAAGLTVGETAGEAGDLAARIERNADRKAL